MLGASSCPTARLDLASIGEKAAQNFGSLVIYDIHLVYAKGAYLATRDVSLTTTGSLTSTTPCPPFGVLRLFVVRQSYLPMYN
jgi:hypothetical protein